MWTKPVFSWDLIIMIALKEILYKVSLRSSSGETDRLVSGICFDSRESEQDFLFVAVKGTQVDGHDYIPNAIKGGCKAIICEQSPESRLPDVTYVEVENSAKALGIIASNFYGNPSGELRVVAVTGTNGKTTIATLLFDLFRNLGYSVGLLSTIHNKINDEVIPATHTTPDAVQIQLLLKKMLNEGCVFVFMEASSHAIHQDRLSGVRLEGAIFSNITHDHLDYHGTFNDYIAAKKKLFDELPKSAFALVNVDDKRGMVMMQNTKASRRTYSLKTMADFKSKVISNTLDGLELDLDGQNVWFKLIGEFNAYNILSVYGAAVLMEEESHEVLMQLTTLNPVAGRFQRVFNPKITAIVDYAHTPDALENVLRTITSLRTGNEQVITVVGCGGDRDKAKRPEMAGIACKMSEKVVLTSDNPRTEDQDQIILDMEQGVPASKSNRVLKISDRREAIKTACMLANEGDIVLLAGKGHEDYQEVNGVRHHFDDREVLNEMLNTYYK